MRSVSLALTMLLSVAFSAEARVYSATQVAALEQLVQTDSFEPTPFYTGVADPVLHARLNSNIQSCVKAAVALAKAGAEPGQIISLIKDSIWHIPREDLDTEDAERYAGGYEAILDALEIESSDGVLNDWMYGFDVEA
jgi:hypothetical protein